MEQDIISKQTPRFMANVKLGERAIAYGKIMASRSPFVGPVRELLGSDKAVNIFQVAHSTDFVYRAVGGRYSKSEMVKNIVIILFLPVIIYVYLIMSVFFVGKKVLDSKYGVRIYQGDYGFIYGKGRMIDFIIDEDVVKSDEVLFCAETELNESYKGEFAIRNRKMTQISEYIMQAPLEIVLRTLVLWPSLVVHAFRAHFIDTKALVSTIYYALAWSGFISRVPSMRVYLVYGDYTPNAIVRNILFSKAGINVWYYCNSYAYWNVYAGGEDKIESILAFYFCDRVIAWGEAQKRYMMLNLPNRRVDVVGCLWAEKIREMVVTHPRSKTITIAVFDTSYGRGGFSIISDDDMFQFLTDVLHLVNDVPEARILFKMKTPKDIEKADTKLKDLYTMIKSHPRITIVYDSASAIAESDLVISACYSSPTSEAWAAGFRAMYHDARGNIRSTLYESFPRSVSHNYDELRGCVHYWLYECTDSEFHDFLNKYIKTEIDPYIDGKGITRLREMMRDA